MKVLKWVLIVLAAIVIVVLIIGLILPAKFKVEQSTVIKAPAGVVFDQVNTLKNWEKWSPWHKIDPKMTITYNNIPSGKGASYTWVGDNGKVGSGTLTINESLKDSLIKVGMNFKGNGDGQADFNFSKTDDGVKVTWTMESDMGGNPFKHVMGAMMKSMLTTQFSDGLAALKEICEKQPVMNSSDNIKVEETTTTDMHALTMHKEGTLKDVGKLYGEAYGTIDAYMKKNNIKEAGYPFCVFPDFKPEDVKMIVGVPVAKPEKGAGDVQPYEMKAGKAVKASFTGPYSQLDKVHTAINKYMADHKQTAGDSWEVYKTNPMTEKDSTKWVTDVYYQIK